MAVVEEGSLNKAALRLHLAQPSLSRQIRDLEARLGVTLLQRTAGGVSTSAAGDELYRQAREMLERLGVLVSSVQAVSGGALRVGYLPSYLAGPCGAALRRTGEECADVQLELVEAVPGELLDRLREGQVDVALIGHYDGPPLADLELLFLHEVPLHAVLPDNHPLAGESSLDLRQLSGDSFLGLDEELFPGRNRVIGDACRACGFDVEFLRRADGLVSLLTLVGLGQGVTLIPADAAVLPHAHSVFVPLQAPGSSIRFHAAVRAGEKRPPVWDLIRRCREEAARF